jgi:hypothetical protein
MAAVQMPPTQAHTAAVWESMLGTVCAADRNGVERYFDYDYDAAIKYAELDGCDLRVARFSRRVRSSGVEDRNGYRAGPRRGQMVLWRRVGR